VTGGKDIPYAAQRRLVKFGFHYFFCFSFTAPPRHLCDGGYRLLSDFIFRLWLTGVDA
jgi:hypothetical protein